MLVGTYLKANVMAVLLLVARPDVSQEIVERIANVWLAVDIRDGGSDVEFLSHWGLL